MAPKINGDDCSELRERERSTDVRVGDDDGVGERVI